MRRMKHRAYAIYFDGGVLKTLVRLDELKWRMFYRLPVKRTVAKVNV